MDYQCIELQAKGGPEQLVLTTKKLLAPKPDEVQIKVLACGVGRTDIAMRRGYYPFAPKIPFVPGYEIIGRVTAVGKHVSEFEINDRVAALTVYGGYSEYITLKQKHLVKVPNNLNPGEAVALILNYITAYQMMKRTANATVGDTVFISGASGGVGTALMDLGKLFGLKMYGTASGAKHHLLKQYGAIPIDYKSEDFEEVISRREPKGIDIAFDGIGGTFINKSFRLLKNGGLLVAYGYPSFLGLLKGLLRVNFLNAFFRTKKARAYGISGSYNKNLPIIKEDMIYLFDLLNQQKIRPIINHRMALLEAREANEMLESGQVSGKIVLLADELLLSQNSPKLDTKPNHHD